MFPLHGLYLIAVVSFIDINFLQGAVFLLLPIYLWSLKNKSAIFSDGSGNGGSANTGLTLSESAMVFWNLLCAEKGSGESPLDISRKFGKRKILTFTFPIPFVICNDYEMTKDIQNSDTWADRPLGQVFSIRSEGHPRGLLQNNGNSWKKVRKYTIKKLGQLGFGKKDRMISFLEGEMQDLISHMDKEIVKSGNKLAVHDLFAISVVNIIWSIAAGEQFSRNDPKYHTLKETTTEMTTLSVAKILIFECAPLRNIIRMAPGLFGFKELFEKIEKLREYFTEVVKTRQKSKQNGVHSDDFIDSFLKEIDINTNKTDIEEDIKGIYCIEELVMIITDLFQAGMDTTSNTLESAMMLMVKYPEVQKKIQLEIDAVVGPSRFPSYFHDKQNMPYTVAAITEINRIINIVPFNGRQARTDCTVGNLKIRKGTFAFLPLHCIRMDEDYWGDPHVFRPERFLDAEGNLIADKITRVMAFGGGVRYCPGEIVAKSILFTFFTGILQRYSVSTADESQILKMSDFASVTNQVYPFLMAAHLRH